MTTPALNWIKEGAGPTLVLSHALGCDLRMWDGVAAILRTRYTVLRYDHRGHGGSPSPPGPYSLAMLADDAAALIRAQVVGPVHFVGLSMGGMTAQALAARHPELLKSVVIANSAPWYDELARALWDGRVKTVMAQGIAAIADAAMQRWFTPEFRADESSGGAARVAALRQGLIGLDAAAYAASCEAVAHIDFRASNRSIACPALVIAGLRDEATPLSQSQTICDSIPGAELCALDAAHLSAVEQPEAFALRVSDFLKRVK